MFKNHKPVWRIKITSYGSEMLTYKNWKGEKLYVDFIRDADMGIYAKDKDGVGSVFLNPAEQIELLKFLKERIKE